MKPLLIAILLVIAPDHRAPAHVPAEAVARFFGVDVLLHESFGRDFRHRGAFWFLVGSGAAFGDADFGAFVVGGGEDAGRGAAAASASAGLSSRRGRSVFRGRGQ